jgi:hypothetical protein
MRPLSPRNRKNAHMKYNLLSTLMFPNTEPENEDICACRTLLKLENDTAAVQTR